MPSGSQSSKRKIDDVGAKPTQSMNAAPPPASASPEEDAVKSTIDSNKKVAFDMFMNTTKNTRPATSLFSSGSVVTGILMGIKPESIKIEDKKVIHKLNCTVAVQSVSGLGSIGVANMMTMFATRNEEATPEQLSKNPSAKGSLVMDVRDDMKTHPMYVIVLKVDDFRYSAQGDSFTENPIPLAGSTVEITGVKCSFPKKDMDGNPVYLNARGISVLEAPEHPNRSVSSVISTMNGSYFQGQTAFFSMLTMIGGAEHMQSVAQQEQLAYGRSKWQQTMHDVRTKVQTLSKNVPEGSKHVFERICQSANEDDALLGGAVYPYTPRKDTTTPYQVPIVQFGLYPGNSIPQMCMDLFDPEASPGLPNSFASAKIVSTETTKNLVEFFYQLYVIHDKEHALKCINEGSNPVVTNDIPQVCVKMSKRTIGNNIAGTLKSNKIDFFITNIYMHADHVVIADVHCKEIGSSQVNGSFPNSYAFNIPRAVQACSVKVSIKFVNETLCRGRGQFVYPKPNAAKLAVEYIEPPKNACDFPSLPIEGYRALTEESFEIEDIQKDTIGCFVVYDGVFEDVANNPQINADANAGEEWIQKKYSDADLVEMIRNECLVYAVVLNL